MKITKYIMMLAAAAGLSVACQKEELVTFNPEEVVAPVLHAVSDVVVTVDNKDTGSLMFSWDPATFGVKAQVYYTLNMTANDVTVNLFSGATGTSYSVSYDALNNKAFNDLGIASGEEGTVTYTLGAKLNVGETYWAEAVSGKITPTSAEKVYPMVYVIGNYCGWSHDTALHLYNFAEDEVLYQGVVDFGAGEEKTGGFKITPAANWDAEWGGSGSADEEPASLTLLTSGGSDIKNYVANRYYHFTFDTKTGVLTKKMAFDQVGIIGLNGDWDNDIVMEYSSAKQRFYADIDVAAATNFKFRMDGGWDVNYGGDLKNLAADGDNIAVEPGQYRVYFNMNNLEAVTATLDEKMYGKEEGGAVTPPSEEPEPTASGWALIGDFNGWGGDLAMTQAGAIWSVKEVELVAGQGFKLRKDGGWDVNRGAAGDVEPFVVTLGEAFEAVAGGKNLTVPADGKYDIYYDEGNEKIYVLAAGADAPTFDPTWFLVGGFNGWAAGDMAYKMTKEGDYYVFKNFVLEADNEVKFNAGGWDVNRGGETFSANAALDVVQDGSNLKVPAGTYDIYMNLATDKAYFMTDGKTPADAGEAEVVVVDYSNCQLELVGSGVVEQEGTTPDTAWTWGNVLSASNEGKPSKEADVYTWTWSNVQLSADGWKIRTLNAAESGGVSNFDLGDGAVDKTASSGVKESTDGNIYVEAGNYNITLVIDAAAATKTVTIVPAN